MIGDIANREHEAVADPGHMQVQELGDGAAGRIGVDVLEIVRGGCDPGLDHVHVAVEQPVRAVGREQLEQGAAPAG